MKLFKSKLGFTLIELLVVIGILAVLAAIAIPSVAGLIDRANVSADKTNANEMTNAIERFTAEYELYCQDIACGVITEVTTDFDAAQGRVYNVVQTKTRDGISDLEVAQNATVADDKIAIYRDTKYPVNTKTLKAIVENYTKTSSATFDPKQSDMHFWYSPACGVVVVATPESSVAEKNDLIISGKDAKGRELDDTNEVWIDVTDEVSYGWGSGENASSNCIVCGASIDKCICNDTCRNAGCFVTPCNNAGCTQVSVTHYCGKTSTSHGHNESVSQNIIPAGAVYKQAEYNSQECEYCCSSFFVYPTTYGGTAFPEAQTGDIFVHNGYVYAYEAKYSACPMCDKHMTAGGLSGCWMIVDFEDGAHGAPLDTINGANVEIAYLGYNVPIGTVPAEFRIPAYATTLQGVFDNYDNYYYVQSNCQKVVIPTSITTEVPNWQNWPMSVEYGGTCAELERTQIFGYAHASIKCTDGMYCLNCQNYGCGMCCEHKNVCAHENMQRCTHTNVCYHEDTYVAWTDEYGNEYENCANPQCPMYDMPVAQPFCIDCGWGKEITCPDCKQTFRNCLGEDNFERYCLTCGSSETWW